MIEFCLINLNHPQSPSSSKSNSSPTTPTAEPFVKPPVADAGLATDHQKRTCASCGLRKTYRRRGLHSQPTSTELILAELNEERRNPSQLAMARVAEAPDVRLADL